MWMSSNHKIIFLPRLLRYVWCTSLGAGAWENLSSLIMPLLTADRCPLSAASCRGRKNPGVIQTFSFQLLNLIHACMHLFFGCMESVGLASHMG